MWKLSDSINKTDFDGESILLDIESGNYFGLNEISAIIVGNIVNGVSVTQIIDQVYEIYEIERTILSRDVNNIINQLVKLGILEEVGTV